MRVTNSWDFRWTMWVSGSQWSLAHIIFEHHKTYLNSAQRQQKFGWVSWPTYFTEHLYSFRQNSWIPVTVSDIMTSWHGNVFCVTGPLRGHRPLVDSPPNDAELWSFLCCLLEKSAEQRVELPMIWDALFTFWCNPFGFTLWTHPS